MISVIIPVSYNQKYFDETLKSLEKQIYQSFEVIVILNGNYELITNIKNYKLDIKLYRFEKESVAEARNYGISKANSDIICFFDSDDIWHPAKLEIQYRSFKEKNCDLSYCRFKILNTNYERNLKNIFSPKDIAINNPICTSSVMIKKEIFQLRNFVNFRMRSDFEFWMFLKKNNFNMCPVESDEPIVYYRKHNFSLTFNKYTASFYHFKILNLHFSFVLSCYLELRYLIFNLMPNIISKKFVKIIKP